MWKICTKEHPCLIEKKSFFFNFALPCAFLASIEISATLARIRSLGSAVKYYETRADDIYWYWQVSGARKWCLPLCVSCV